MARKWDLLPSLWLRKIARDFLFPLLRVFHTKQKVEWARVTPSFWYRKQLNSTQRNVFVGLKFQIIRAVKLFFSGKRHIDLVTGP